MSESFVRAETWDGLNEKVTEVGVLAASLLGFCDELRSKSGLVLETLLEQWPGFSGAVLGGVNQVGEYGPVSLASRFRALFGARVDTKQYVTLQPFGEAGRRIPLQWQDTPFVALLDTTLNLARLAMEKWGEGTSSRLQSPSSADKYGHEPGRAVADAQAFLSGLANFSAGVDTRMMFLFMSRRITARYLFASFPESSDEAGLGFLKTRIGLQMLWQPELRPQEYVLWGYRDYRDRIRLYSHGDAERSSEVRKLLSNVQTYAAALLTLNRLAWLVFFDKTGSAYSLRSIAEQLFSDVPTLPEEFRERARPLLAGMKRPLVELENQVGRIEAFELADSVMKQGGRVMQGWSGSIYDYLDWLIPAVAYGQYGVAEWGKRWSIERV